MVKKLLYFVAALFLFQTTFSQTNGWWQYGRPTNINALDKRSNGEILAGTDFGLVEFNNTLDVSTYYNLTSQAFPVGNVLDLSIDPNSEDYVALTTYERVLVLDVANDIIENAIPMNNSTGLPIYNEPQVHWGKSGDLYFWDPQEDEVTIISGGTINPTMSLPFTPVAVVENNAGTKVFFGSWNSGVWEYDKSTMTWTQHTELNSNLNDNGIKALHVDKNDLLYIGTFQGLNTLDSSGTMNSYQQQIPGSAFFFPVNEIDVHPTTGKVLVRSSEPSVSYAGVCEVDLTTNTWTNFTNDGTNCLDQNVFTHVMYNVDGSRIIACESSFLGDANNTFLFDPANPTSSCSQVDFNYLGAEEISNAGWTQMGLRPSSTPGTFDIGFTNSGGFHIINIPQSGFSGPFPAPTSIVPAPGQFYYDVLSMGDQFGVTDNLNNVNFINQSNTVTSHNLNIAGFSINIAKIANVVVDGNTCQLVFNGFEGANRTLYTTECDLTTSSCDIPVQIFTTNRDLTTDIPFGCTESNIPGEFKVAGMKTNGSGNPSLEVNRITSDGTSKLLSDDDVSPYVSGSFYEPLFYNVDDDDDSDPLFVSDDEKSLFSRTESGGIPTFQEHELDEDDVDDFDQTLLPSNISFASTPNQQTQNSFENCAVFFEPSSFEPDNFNLRVDISQGEIFTGSSGSRRAGTSIPSIKITGSEFQNLPSNLQIYDSRVLVHDNTYYASVLRTNYGLLINPSIDYTSLFLSSDETSLAEKNTKLYPNPARTEASFSSNNVVKVQLYNLHGKHVKTFNGNRFSLNGLSSGIYMVKGYNNNGEYIVKKLIKN